MSPIRDGMGSMGRGHEIPGDVLVGGYITGWYQDRYFKNGWGYLPVLWGWMGHTDDKMVGVVHTNMISGEQRCGGGKGGRKRRERRERRRWGKRRRGEEEENEVRREERSRRFGSGI
eukprot:763135-Hanusia_phi.AAC.3